MVVIQICMALLEFNYLNFCFFSGIILSFLSKIFIESRFSCCLLPRLICISKLNNKIKRLHERALRIAYVDHVLGLYELLIKDGSLKFTNAIGKYYR